MKKFFLIISLSGFLSCSDKTEEKPADLLPPEKLTSILADIHLAETRVEKMGLQPDTAKVIFKRLQKEALLKHEVSEEEFQKSYAYYQEHLVQLDKIYEALIDTLGMREIKLTTK